MHREEFLDKSFVIAGKWFVGVGPLIGGLYMAAKTGVMSEAPNLFFMFFVIIYSYIIGIFPAVIAAAVWYALVYAISYASIERLLNMPLAFLLGSLVVSGLAGLCGVLLMEYLSVMPTKHSLAAVGAIAGCASGFMSANGVLKSAGT